MWTLAIGCIILAVIGMLVLNIYGYHCRGELGCGKWFFAWNQEHAWKRYYRHVEECHGGIIR